MPFYKDEARVQAMVDEVVRSGVIPKHSPKCDRDLCDPTDCDYRTLAEMTDQPYAGRNRGGDRPGLFRRRR